MTPGLLILAERVPPQRGGLAVATGRIAQHALQAGMRVHVVHPTRDLAPGDTGHRERDGVQLHPIGAYDSDEQTLRAWYGFAERVAQAEALSVVHGIYATRAGYLAAMLGARTQRASVVSLRGNDLDRGLFRTQDLPFLDFALRRATVVTGVSAALSETAAAVSGRPVRHVTNAVDADRFEVCGADNTLRAALGLGRSTVLGFLGELREKKGMRYLLPALDALITRGRDVRLLLLGGVRAEMQPALQEFSRMAPEAFSRIHIIEYERDPGRLSRLMGQCDLMVFPSLMDGTPNAVLEAMACGRLILATDAGGQADLLAHGETGGLLPVQGLTHLPEAIEEMLGLPQAERRRMAKAARAHVMAAHALQDEKQAYQDVYAEARRAVADSRSV